MIKYKFFYPEGFLEKSRNLVNESTKEAASSNWDVTGNQIHEDLLKRFCIYFGVKPEQLAKWYADEGLTP